MADPATSIANRPTGLFARATDAARIAPQGAPIIVALLVLAAISFLLGFRWPALLMLILAAALAAFFRDPHRYPQRTEGVVLAGADGRVVNVAPAVFPTDAGGACSRVSIFMSPLNVHVNRAPVAGEIASITYTPGSFRAAFGDLASEHNERNLIEFRASGEERHAMVQVAGYLARRIVCAVRVRDRIEVGQRVGIIMFGSRVDHYVPRGYRVAVTSGQTVRAAETVIAELEQ
ncbi:MAG: phosphatidylserine decarboxylase [Candidatus Binataceae bacterium]